MTDAASLSPCPPDDQPVGRMIAMPADANPEGDIFGGWLRLNLTGEEIVTIRGLSDANVGRLKPRQELWVELFRPSDGKMARFPVRCRIDNATEMDYFKAGGVMPYVLRNLARG